MSTSSGIKPTPPRSPGQGKNAWIVWGVILLVCAAALVGTYLLFVKGPPPSKIIIATGGQAGKYNKFGKLYAESLKKEGLAVEVLETKGSGENLKLLQDDPKDIAQDKDISDDTKEKLKALGGDALGVSVAFVQSGVADEEAQKNLQALGSLYREPLWVFYRANPDDPAVTQLSQLAGKKISVGPKGSGTWPIAVKLLHDNGLSTPEGAGEENTDLSTPKKIDDAAADLQAGKLDAAFFVTAFDTDYIQDLLKHDKMALPALGASTAGLLGSPLGQGPLLAASALTPGRTDKIRLLSFTQQEAYHRKYPYLSELTIPAGLADLGRNVPANNASLLAPTAMLVARKDVNPDLVPLLLTVASSTHGKGDLLSNPGEFPSASYTDIPVSPDAENYYKNGPPLLQKLGLPFWLASLIDRLKVMLVPLIVLFLPLFRAAPPLVRWRTRRKIYRWYSALRDIDKKIVLGLAGAELDKELARLRDISRQVAFVEVPLSYMEEFYHLRLHLRMLQEQLEKMRAQQERAGDGMGAAAAPPT